MEKKTKTEQYVSGMQAINNFYSMLYQAMKEALPTARISKNGAYGWRGYQINSYEDLATNQYYCQIYSGDPFKFTDKHGRIAAFTSRELVFQEAYKDPSHKPFDEYENILCIKTGDYYYPFHVSLDLFRSRFFLMDRDEQYVLSTNFVTYASQQAIIWQRSQARRNVTNEKFLKGNKNRKIATDIPDQFEKVEFEFLTAWGKQDELFRKLIRQLNPYKPQSAKKEKDWIRANASIYNFGFRGYRLKSGKFSPDEFDLVWRIYFEKPELLSCLTTDEELIESYNLVVNKFFDMSAEQQDADLDIFIKKCIG